MVKAVLARTPGGPEVLSYEEVAVPDPGPGEVRLRHTAIGVNFIDIYKRAGLYRLPHYPTVIGEEGVGIVEAVGAGVADFAPGDRVGYASTRDWAYAEARVIEARRLTPIPDDITDAQAAGSLVRGLTAEYLLRRCHRLQAGETLLIHAAAGGVGLMVCQWAKHLGARVIGTVGAPAKAEIARAHGCDHTILYREQDFVARVREITGGRGVDVAYDSVGKDTFLGSLDCLRPRGLLVSFGNASGPPDPIAPLELSRRGALYLTRPTLGVYVAEPGELHAAARALWAMIRGGALRVNIGREYPLRDAAQAQIDLAARRTTGSIILRP